MLLKLSIAIASRKKTALVLQLLDIDDIGALEFGFGEKHLLSKQ
jgi:hypothetical protein